MPNARGRPHGRQLVCPRAQLRSSLTRPGPLRQRITWWWPRRSGGTGERIRRSTKREYVALAGALPNTVQRLSRAGVGVSANDLADRSDDPTGVQCAYRLFCRYAAVGRSHLMAAYENDIRRRVRESEEGHAAPDAQWRVGGCFARPAVEVDVQNRHTVLVSAHTHYFTHDIEPLALESCPESATRGFAGAGFDRTESRNADYIRRPTQRRTGRGICAHEWRRLVRRDTGPHLSGTDRAG
jgi:hypothetical protein